MLLDAVTEIKVRVAFGDLVPDARITEQWERLRPHLEVIEVGQYHEGCATNQTIQPSFLRFIQQTANFRPRPGHAPTVRLTVCEDPELTEREIAMSVLCEIQDVPTCTPDDLAEEAASYALTVERHIDAWLESMLLGGYGRVRVAAETPEPTEASAEHLAALEARRREVI